MRRNWLTIVVVCSAWTSGCGEKGPEFSATYITQDPARRNLKDQKGAMVDSALLRDVALTDIHFVPHQAALNELGHLRLERYIDLLQEHGGTLRIEGRNANEDFVRARTDSVVTYLAAQGVDRNRIAVAPGVRAGTGMAAVEGIEVKKRAYEPDRSLTDLTTGGSGGTLGTN